MKKFAWLIVFAILGYLPAATGQGVDKAVASGAEIDVKNVPGTVLESMEKGLPGMKVESYHMLSADDYREVWETTKDPSLTSLETGPYYTAYYSGKKLKGRAVYNKDGQLLKYHEVVKDAALPKEVTDAITSKYPGWTVVKDTEVVNSTAKGDATYYKVKLKNQGKTKTVVYDTSGFVLWEN